MLASAEILHDRLGITCPNLMRRLATTSIGVAQVTVSLNRSFISNAYHEAASRRCKISGERMIESILADMNMPPGTVWAGDPTARMVVSLDGNRFAFIFMELSTGFNLPVSMKEKTTRSCIKAFEEPEATSARLFPGTTVRQIHLDSDPVWAKQHPSSPMSTTRNVQELDAWLSSRTDMLFKHSPPHTQALNPAENISSQAYFKMN